VDNKLNIQELKSLIGNNKTKDVLNKLLSSQIVIQDKNLHNDILLQSSKWTEYRRDRRNDVKSNEELVKISQKVNEALLEILDIIEEKLFLLLNSNKTDNSLSESLEIVVQDYETGITQAKEKNVDRSKAPRKIVGEQLKTNDKSVHIIDKIYDSLKRFEGLNFIDPNYIAILYPFNILTDHVWHYHDKNLFTINNEIYNLLCNLNVEENEVKFTDDLETELLSFKVDNAKDKIEWIFNFLNHCMIYEVSAIENYEECKKNATAINFSERHRFQFSENEGVTKEINVTKNKICNCLVCIYRSLNFKMLLRKLTSNFGNNKYNSLEYAYGNYLTGVNYYKNSYTIYKTIEEETANKSVEYFLAKQNTENLHNLIKYYDLDDSEEIMRDIKSIYLDDIIHAEIEVDRDVKNYLIKLKENAIIYKIQDKIGDALEEIRRSFNIVHNSRVLQHQYQILYLHVNLNYFVYDIFERYRKTASKVFKGLVISYLGGRGITSFSEFFLSEAILHVRTNQLQDILKNIESIEVNRGDDVDKLLVKLNSYTSSFYEDGLLGITSSNSLLKQYSSNHFFESKLTDIFSNLFTILCRLNIANEQFEPCREPLLKFLKVEKILNYIHLKEFANFLIKKGNLFNVTDLESILKIAINGHSQYYTKYESLVKRVPLAILKHFPSCKFKDEHLVKTIILNSSSQSKKHANYSFLIPLFQICDERCKQILLDIFDESLDRKFKVDFFQKLLLGGYDYNRKNYFEIYSAEINRTKRNARIIGYEKFELDTSILINFVWTLYTLKIDFQRDELKVFTDLNEFESWLLYPNEFDYEKFDVQWLIDIHNYKCDAIFERLKGNSNAINALESKLKEDYNPILAEIKYTYLA